MADRTGGRIDPSGPLGSEVHDDSEDEPLDLDLDLTALDPHVEAELRAHYGDDVVDRMIEGYRAGSSRY